MRVGVTTAKLLAYAAGGEVLGVDTLEVIASRAPAEIAAVSAAIDAQRGQVVVGEFRRDASAVMIPAGPEALVDVEVWLDRLSAATWITGPALRKWAQRVPESLHGRTLDPSYWSADGRGGRAIGDPAARGRAPRRPLETPAALFTACRRRREMGSEAKDEG